MVFRDWTLVMVFIILSFFAFQEFLRLVLSIPSWNRTFLLIVIALVFFYLPIFYPHPYVTIGWYGFFLLLVFWGFLDRGRITERIGFFLFGMVYCIILPYFWVKTGLDFGRLTLVGFALLIWLNDIGAYLIGKKWGRHKIVPIISPGKSWEGLGGGVVLTCGGAVLFPLLFSFQRSPAQSVVIGLTIALIGFLGDLLESALKREFQMKDSGQFLPGHGGFLDRFDSFFFAGPAVYFIHSWWGG